jgi:disulfide bond formation protein DsbB
VDAGQVADFMGTLATIGVLGLVVLVGTAVLAPDRLARLRDRVASSTIAVGAAVAAVAMAGSLWFSEVADFPPCDLCWYQRIAMYPLVLLLGLAAVRRDHRIRLYGIALAGAGLAVSAYHNLIETFPEVDGGSCSPTAPCTVRWVEGLGFWTIPRMSFVAFALVITCLLLDRPPTKEPAS